MLSGVEKIDDFDGPGKMQSGGVPDPFGAVADDDLLLRPVPATLEGLGIDAAAELIGILNRSRICCGSNGASSS
jgi:hypothetical protein